LLCYNELHQIVLTYLISIARFRTIKRIRYKWFYERCQLPFIQNIN